MGAVRIGRIEGELIVNPTYQQLDESSLDLIVVGTREALTMIEAGADQVPEDTMLEAFALAHSEIIRICDAIDELAREVGKEKLIDVELNSDARGASRRCGRPSDRRGRPQGVREHRRRAARESAPAITMDSTESDIVRELQVRNGLQTLLETKRLAAVESAVRAQFESELRALTDAEQDSKELKGAQARHPPRTDPGGGPASVPGRRR